MKIKKYNENSEEQLINLQLKIFDILDNELELRNIRFTDDEEISYESKVRSAIKIIEYLKNIGLLFALDTKKYNL